MEGTATAQIRRADDVLWAARAQPEPRLQFSQRGGEAMTSALLVGAVVGALGLVSFLAWLLRAQRRRQDLPPERSGWLPWLGCAVDFGKAPLFFIQKTRKEVGSLIGSHGKLCSMPAAQGSDCIHLLHWMTFM